MYFSNDKVCDEILQFVQTNFGFHIKTVRPVFRGLKNLKWIVETVEGKELFIKQFHPKRYPPEKLIPVQTALRIQDQLYKAGLPCPKLYGINHNFVLNTPANIFFCLEDAYGGNVMLPGEPNVQQMFDLGRVTGYMHELLQSVPREELHWFPSKPEMIKLWEQQWNNAKAENKSAVLSILEKQKQIIDALDINQFQECQTGWSHQDFWIDNILFYEDRVSVILDFDDMKVVFPELDVARVTLSCAYSAGKGMNWEAFYAFINGYREYFDLTQYGLARSLRLLWCKETPLWVTAFEDPNEILQRYFAQMCWITDNWFDLEEILNGIQ